MNVDADATIEIKIEGCCWTMSASKRKELLIIFPLSCRFFLDIVAARFYTFFNCNVFIAESMQPIEKGE